MEVAHGAISARRQCLDVQDVLTAGREHNVSGGLRAQEADDLVAFLLAR
jgi:hypothetical protein